MNPTPPGSLPERPKKRNRRVLSCMECHRRKQKCSRDLPCNECRERKVPQNCFFQPEYGPLPGNQTGNASRRRKPISSASTYHIFSSESVAALRTAKAATLSNQTPPIDQISNRAQGFNLFSPDDLHRHVSRTRLLNHAFFRASMTSDFISTDIPPPLGSQDPFNTLPRTASWQPKHLLIHYFIQRLVPWLSAYEETDGQTTTPKLSWLPEAIAHPALFHATLLAAAVHLGRFQPRTYPLVAIWSKTETLRLMNAALRDPAEGASDHVILTTLVLLYFNVGGGDPVEYEIHLMGINQMLKVRGGIARVGLRGMIKNWLTICYGPWSEGWESGRFLDD